MKFKKKPAEGANIIGLISFNAVIADGMHPVNDDSELWTYWGHHTEPTNWKWIEKWKDAKNTRNEYNKAKISSLRVGLITRIH